MCLPSYFHLCLSVVFLFPSFPFFFSQNADVMALLRPLLLDTVPSIQQSAALALGRLANYSEALAEAVVMNEVLPQLVYSLSEQNVSRTKEKRKEMKRRGEKRTRHDACE